MMKSNEEKYDEEYYERGPVTGKSLYMNYRWMPELTIRMVYFMIKNLGIKDDDSILDFGCAKGFTVRALRLLGFDAWGIDVSEYAIANVLPEVRRYCSVATYFEGRYDWVTAKNVLEHIPEPGIDTTLKMLAGNTKKMFAVIPLGTDNGSDRFVIPSDNDDPSHELAKPRDWWEAKFLACGFALERFSSTFKGCKENYTTKWPEGNGFFQLVSLKEKSGMEHVNFI